MLTANQIKTVYKGRLPRAKMMLLDYMEKDGYRFMKNNYRTMELAPKWADFDLVQVASSNTAGYLWAVRAQVTESRGV